MYSSSCTTSALDWGEWSAWRPDRAKVPGKGPPVPTVQGAGWAPQPVWTQRLEEKSFSFWQGSNIERRSPGRPVRSQTLYWLSYPGSCWLLVRTHKYHKENHISYIIHYKEVGLEVNTDKTTQAYVFMSHHQSNKLHEAMPFWEPKSTYS
jgi:hypothetical protein